MITPEEIKSQCLKWWKEVLLASLDQQQLFPREIPRIGKVSTKDILSNLKMYKDAIELLSRHEKIQKGFGYSVTWNERNFDKIGRHRVPEKITIETLEDYLKLVNKEKDYHYFQQSVQFILSQVPGLKNWIYEHPTKVIGHSSWKDTLNVCAYFLENHKPNLYIRQLPIRVHTKYIKNEHEALFRSLLDHLIPEAIQPGESHFEKRYNLKYPEPLIRLRFLDHKLTVLPQLSDISIPLSDFSAFACPCRNIIVTENQMNFLTLPELNDTIALWSGGGFNVSYLRDTEWLKSKHFYYWGDMDSHGFLILHQFRSYFDSVDALMMDETTFNAHKNEVLTGPVTRTENLSKLNAAEQKLYNKIRTEGLRLEQEKIPQQYAEQVIFNTLKNK